MFYFPCFLHDLHTDLLIGVQFIYNAVAAHCVEVATHRHGCCVLQRCIDHASDSQRVQLVTEITYNALTLVQDPYGNYVSCAPHTSTNNAQDSNSLFNLI